MKKYPKITVVTPSFNQGQFIEATIQSVLGQEYPNLEYIICDGGSTDGTVDILKKYDDKIAWWCSEKDKGQSNAINKGMRRATGDIVCWINSDDVLLPGALLAVAKFYSNHPDTDFANGYTVEIDKEGTIINFTHIIMSHFFFRHGCYNISQPGMFWKRAIFDKIGYLDESFHAKMDVEWLIRVYEAGLKVRRINCNLGAIRIYPETKTAQGGAIWKRDADALKDKYHGQYLPENNKLYQPFFKLYKLLNGCKLRNVIRKWQYCGKPFTAYKENL